MKSNAETARRSRPAWLLCLLLLATLLAAQPAAADDTVEMHTERFSAQGNYAIAAAGVGMLDSSSGDIILDVPGQSVKAAYLYWSGLDGQDGGDDTVTLARDGGGEPTTITADPTEGTYGPLVWWNGNYYFAYVADVTQLVEPGAHAYTVGDFGDDMMRRDGAGLMVVYEDPEFSYGEVQVRDGLDRFYRYWGGGPRAESAVNCFTFEADDVEREMGMTSFVGEIYMGGAPRHNALWYKTGIPGESLPADMVSAPTNGPLTGDLLQGYPDSPFISQDGPQWDTYAKTLTIPAGHTWACLQIESAQYASDDPASGVWLANGIALRVKEPSRPTPTETSAPTPTPTWTPTPTSTAIPTPSDGKPNPPLPEPPKPLPPPAICVPWLVVIPCCLLIGLLLLIVLLVRRRRQDEEGGEE